MNSAKKVPILDVVQYYTGIELKRKGREYWGCCPLHPEKSPSFAVNSEKNVWNCYGGCGGGSAVDLVMRLKNLSFKDSCELIEADFNLSRDGPLPAKTQSQIQANNEAKITDYIQMVFELSLKYERVIDTELHANYKNPAKADMDKLEILVKDKDLLGKITELIACGEPESVVLAVKMYNGRRLADGKFGGSNFKYGL